MINRSLATQVPVRGEVDARVQVEVEIEVEVEVEIEIEIEIEGTVARCAG